MGQQIFQVDAFTQGPFASNPAAVCVMACAANETWMQDVAREMNLSETAFLYPEGDDLCGHATLASAHVLWEVGHLPVDEQARFQTRSGLLTADKVGELIELDFPAEPVQAIEPPSGLAEALGIMPSYVGKGRFNYLFEVESEETVWGIEPDSARCPRCLSEAT